MMVTTQLHRDTLAEPPDTPGHGPEAFLATARWLTRAFTDLAVDIDTIVVEGDPAITERRRDTVDCL